LSSTRTGYAAMPSEYFMPPRAGALIQFYLVMKRWECTICGYVHEGEEPPDVCPVCDAPKELFFLLKD
ncbi:MAG: fumarate reductase/succinate dehydrogenase flavoprotein domain protein, partial [Actinobacteria bacterium]|nr:fumarate reductase/succinate dehydrogenase flavoprotein domain protein [Actinomycetota bacterium]